MVPPNQRGDVCPETAQASTPSISEASRDHEELTADMIAAADAADEVRGTNDDAIIQRRHAHGEAFCRMVVLALFRCYGLKTRGAMLDAFEAWALSLRGAIGVWRAGTETAREAALALAHDASERLVEDDTLSSMDDATNALACVWFLKNPYETVYVLEKTDEGDIQNFAWQIEHALECIAYVRSVFAREGGAA